MATIAAAGLMAVSSTPLAFSTLCAKGNRATPLAPASIAGQFAVHSNRRACRCAAASDDKGETSTSGSAVDSAGSEAAEESSVPERVPRRRGDAAPPRVADSTDWISSSLTRRFGLGAGLAWVGVLAFGVVSEQVKTRNELFREEQGTRDVLSSKEVTLPSGIRYTDLRKGGGTSPQRGDLVVINLTGRVPTTGATFVDTTATGARPVAFIFGARPYSGGMCDGLEIVLRDTRVGGKRLVTVPPEFAFGEAGATFSNGAEVPGNTTLEYVVELLKASIAPS